jgi:hypothetical protein
VISRSHRTKSSHHGQGKSPVSSVTPLTALLFIKPVTLVMVSPFGAVRGILRAVASPPKLILCIIDFRKAQL